MERERARARASSSKELPGLRSFGILAVYGSLAGFLASVDPRGWLYSTMLTLGFLILLAAYTCYRLFVTRTGGVTTPIVMLLVYLIGFASGLGYTLEAVASSALVTLVLALKAPVARLVQRISYEELLAIFELALFYLAFAPLVYTLNYSIAGVPLSTIYTFFLLVLSVNFAGYIAWRIGASPAVYAVLGGFVNSEATIALLARQGALEEPLAAYTVIGMQYKSVGLAAAAALLSHGAEFAAVSVTPLLPALIASTIAASMWRPKREPQLQFTSPLELGVAVRTVALYTLLFLAGAALKPMLTRPEAIAAYALLGGFVSATAAVFALAAYLPPDPLLHSAAYALTIVAATLNKPLYARVGGREAWRTALRVSIILAAPFTAAAAAAWAAMRR